MIWLLMSLCAVAFAACGSDDDDDKSGGDGQGTGKTVTLAQAVGTWQLKHSSGYEVNVSTGERQDEYDADDNSDRLVIESDGTITVYHRSSSSGTERVVFSGKLTVSNGYIVLGKIENITLTSLTITGNILKVETIEEFHESDGDYKHYSTQTYQKVS